MAKIIPINNADRPDLVSPKTAARAWDRKCVRSFREWLAEKKVPLYVLNQRTFRYAQSDLDNLSMKLRMT